MKKFESIIQIFKIILSILDFINFKNRGKEINILW